MTVSAAIVALSAAGKNGLTVDLYLNCWQFEPN